MRGGLRLRAGAGNAITCGLHWWSTWKVLPWCAPKLQLLGLPDGWVWGGGWWRQGLCEGLSLLARCLLASH